MTEPPCRASQIWHEVERALTTDDGRPLDKHAAAAGVRYPFSEVGILRCAGRLDMLASRAAGKQGSRQPWQRVGASPGHADAAAGSLNSRPCPAPAPRARPARLRLCLAVDAPAEPRHLLRPGEADLTLKLKGVDPGALPRWHEGAVGPACLQPGGLPALMARLRGSRTSRPVRQHKCHHAFHGAPPPCPPARPGLEPSVRGAALGVKVEDDVHCAYERQSYSAMYHRALRLHARMLRKLKREPPARCAGRRQGVRQPSMLGGGLGCWGACMQPAGGGPQIPRPPGVSPLLSAGVRRYFPTLPKLLHLSADARLPARLDHYQRCAVASRSARGRRAACRHRALAAGAPGTPQPNGHRSADLRTRAARRTGTWTLAACPAPCSCTPTRPAARRRCEVGAAAAVRVVCCAFGSAAQRTANAHALAVVLAAHRAAALAGSACWPWELSMRITRAAAGESLAETLELIAAAGDVLEAHGWGG